MPGPIVPRPAPTPRAMPFVLPWAMSVRTPSVSSMGPSSLVFRGCLTDVDRGEDGEDEGLKPGDQDDLEDEEGDGDGERDRADRRDAQDHGQAAGHEQDQQVARQHVGEQPYRQRDDPYEVRDRLD